MLSRLRMQGAAVLASLCVATGCGVPLQDEPSRLDVRPVATETSPTARGSSLMKVYLVRDGRLVEEVRTAYDVSARSALRLLAEGPTESEKGEGTTTAVAPGDYTLEQPSGLVTVIDVPVQFTQVEGDLQLLAAAQIVWTVTERRSRGVVRMTFENEPIELPTDQGLTSGAVRRSDYRTVAPVAD